MTDDADGMETPQQQRARQAAKRPRLWRIIFELLKRHRPWDRMEKIDYHFVAWKKFNSTAVFEHGHPDAISIQYHDPRKPTPAETHLA